MGILEFMERNPWLTFFLVLVFIPAMICIFTEDSKNKNL